MPYKLPSKQVMIKRLLILVPILMFKAVFVDKDISCQRKVPEATNNVLNYESKDISRYAPRSKSLDDKVADAIVSGAGLHLQRPPSRMTIAVIADVPKGKIMQTVSCGTDQMCEVQWFYAPVFGKVPSDGYSVVIFLNGVAEPSFAKIGGKKIWLTNVSGAYVGEYGRQLATAPRLLCDPSRFTYGVPPTVQIPGKKVIAMVEIPGGMSGAAFLAESP